MIILSLDELALLSYLSKNGKQPLKVAIDSCLRGDADKPHIEVLEKYGLLIKEGDYLSVSEGVELIFREFLRRGIDPFYLPESTTWLVIDPYPVFKECKFDGPVKSQTSLTRPLWADDHSDGRRD